MRSHRHLLLWRSMASNSLMSWNCRSSPPTALPSIFTICAIWLSEIPIGRQLRSSRLFASRDYRPVWSCIALRSIIARIPQRYRRKFSIPIFFIRLLLVFLMMPRWAWIIFRKRKNRIHILPMSPIIMLPEIRQEHTVCIIVQVLIGHLLQFRGTTVSY